MTCYDCKQLIAENRRLRQAMHVLMGIDSTVTSPQVMHYHRLDGSEHDSTACNDSCKYLYEDGEDSTSDWEKVTCPKCLNRRQAIEEDEQRS